MHVPMDMYHIYADESCKDSHKVLVLGGLIVDSSEDRFVCNSLRAVREKYQTFGEVKWTKTSAAKLDFYKAFADVFFDRACKDEMHFHSLVVETATFDHTRHNMGDAEIGFNKLIYQLMLHKFGRKYGNKPLYVFLDDRTSKTSPDEMRPMLNSELKKRWSKPLLPFRRIHFTKSHESEILQLNDLLIGAIGFRQNGRHHDASSSQHKCNLAAYIGRKIKMIQTQKPNDRNAPRFTIWNFAYRTANKKMGS